MPDEQKGELIRILHRFQRMKKQRVFSENMPQSEFFMLMAIVERQKEQHRNGIDVPGITVTELAQTLSITNPAVSKMLRGMEEKGYILRIPDTSDRRVTYITLSEKGIRITSEAKRDMEHTVERITRLLGEEDTKELTRLLEKLASIIETTDECK